MTVDEFLGWAEGVEGRWELIDGRPIAMAPERAAHLLAKARSWMGLQSAVERASLPRTAFPVGATVRVTARTALEPDALVTCGAPIAPDAIEIANPMIVVEVLSEGIARRDHGVKLEGYFSPPSVAHYLILDPELGTLIHHRRGLGDLIETRILTGGTLRLDPPRLELVGRARRRRRGLVRRLRGGRSQGRSRFGRLPQGPLDANVSGGLAECGRARIPAPRHPGQGDLDPLRRERLTRPW